MSWRRLIEKKNGRFVVDKRRLTLVLLVGELTATPIVILLARSSVLIAGVLVLVTATGVIALDARAARRRDSS